MIADWNWTVWLRTEMKMKNSLSRRSSAVLIYTSDNDKLHVEAMSLTSCVETIVHDEAASLLNVMLVQST